VSQVGLHLRLDDSLIAVANQALALELPVFQSFVVGQTATGHIKIPTDQEITKFRKICEKRFTKLYAHGSFWLNLADPLRSSLDGVWYQVQLAQRLGFTHLILHPGSSVKATKQEGIEMVARTLNQLFKKQSSITILLENTAHGNRAVGSSLEDLAAIRALLDIPEKLYFCLDTAHAHVYGYTVNSAAAMTNFLHTAETILGNNTINLLHLNDASDASGSCKDRHAILGTGTLGDAALHAAHAYAQERGLPLIIEPPLMGRTQLQALYNSVVSWQN